MGRKAQVLTWDSLFAFTLVIVVITTFASIQKFQPGGATEAELQTLHASAEELMHTLQSKGVLEEAGRRYAAGDDVGAKAVLDTAMEDYAPPNLGYKFQIDDDDVTEGGPVAWDDASSRTAARRLVSGISNATENITGYVARAWWLENGTVANIEEAFQEDPADTPAASVLYNDFTITSGGTSEVVYLRVPLGVNVYSAYFSIDAKEVTTSSTTSTSTSTTTTSSGSSSPLFATGTGTKEEPIGTTPSTEL